MKSPDGIGKTHEPITLAERRAFLKLPLEERRRILAKQARELAAGYRRGKAEDLETGEFFDY